MAQLIRRLVPQVLIARRCVGLIFQRAALVVDLRTLCTVPASGESTAVSSDVASSPGEGRPGDLEEKVKGDIKDGPYDVAIVGGGMVGLAVACALSSMQLTKHLSIAIIDSNPLLSSKRYLNKDDIPDPRVSTITPATISFFIEIGAWEHILQQRHAFFDQMQVWDYTGMGFTRYTARDVGKENLGCVVENKVLCNSLLMCLQEQKDDGEKIIYPSKLESVVFPKQSEASKQSQGGMAAAPGIVVDQLNDSKLAKLHLSDGQSLHAKLLVGADGAKSHVRQAAGVKTTGWNYSQSAVICSVEHSSVSHCAWQRFLPTGPIALLPIGDNFSNIVWTMTPDDAVCHASMSSDDFVRSVNHALDFGYGPHPGSNSIGSYIDSLFSAFGNAASAKERFEVPPKITNVVSERMAFPLSLMHAHSYVSKRLALVGDAAHTVHPLAGQGANLGFGDAAALARVIADAVSVGSDIGDHILLSKYERERKAENMAMMAILDAFQKAYTVDFGPINIIRAAAFHGAQYISPLKKNIISYGIGEGRLPFFA